MTRRAHQRDTEADLALYRCINSSPPRSFLMVAGAGSGKTTSLIKALTEILDRHGERLRLRRQKVACITYTDIAAREIWADVGNNPLVQVSTIHSFLWFLVRSFQADIQEWVGNRIDDKLAELREVAASFGPRVQQRTREKNRADIVRYEQQRARIGQVRSFTYGTGSDYMNGILGHNDIIEMVPQLIIERPLMRSLVAQQFPFLFVDESQDTTEKVVDALRAVNDELGDRFCLGFFGDPMQRIYPTGIGAISMGATWVSITKPENFRCPTTVLSVANAIRRDVGDLVQTRGRMTGPPNAMINVAGSANLFILPIDERRDQRIAQVRDWTSREYEDPAWLSDNGEEKVKILVIVHRMAAMRLGFGDLYAALNDKAPDKFKNGFLDGTAWPVRPFTDFILPLVSASKKRDEFEIMQILRRKSPLLSQGVLNRVNVAERLGELRRFTDALHQMMEPEASATNADVLRYVYESKVIALDPRILTHLSLSAEAEPIVGTGEATTDDGDDEEVSKEVSAMAAFLDCPAAQFWGYYTYVTGNSPFSTQQGIKGAEFERVLVVLDDDEGTHVQFSYEKYFGLKRLSDKEEANRREGKETVIDRTRRLFYVCCTRALKDLAVVLFTGDVAAARRQIETLGLFPSDAIYLEEDISGG